ncbi:helix-turn-helix domain-containing protein [Phyllobacterium sp. TAF24]|uniref:helix-turn-helix domain-containing protein n=1 Tax=Phyllobacterium sp. TAF24 TaxID=3233068 RepID=UPI003F98B0D1
MGNKLRELRLARKMTHDEAATAMGVSRSQFIKLERGERRLTVEYLNQAAKAFGVTPAELLEDVVIPETTPIVGRAGAGPDGSVLFATGDGNFGEIPAPVNSTTTTEALEVQGDSMTGIANDGWVITYDEKQPPNEDHMGEPCVCWLEDHRVLVKIPFPGRGAGLYDLESASAKTMRDVPVRYFALVTNIIPRKAAKKFIKRNPDHQIEDVSIKPGE